MTLLHDHDLRDRLNLRARPDGFPRHGRVRARSDLLYAPHRGACLHEHVHLSLIHI